MVSKLWNILPFGNKDLSCGKLREMSSDFLEGGLGTKELWRFNYHVERCGGCNAFVSGLCATIQTLNSLPSQKAPEELKRRLSEHFKEEDSNTGASA